MAVAHHARSRSWPLARPRGSSSSRMRTPAPSPMTKPSRSLSKGREAAAGSSLRVESARMALKPPTPRAVIAASLPPAIMTSASPRWISRIGVAHRVRARSAGRRGGRRRPARAGPDGHPARGQVDDGRGDEEGRNPPRPAVDHLGVLSLDGRETADAAADEDAHPLGLLAGEGRGPSPGSRTRWPPPRAG